MYIQVTSPCVIIYVFYLFSFLGYRDMVTWALDHKTFLSTSNTYCMLGTQNPVLLSLISKGILFGGMIPDAAYCFDRILYPVIILIEHCNFQCPLPLSTSFSILTQIIWLSHVTIKRNWPILCQFRPKQDLIVRLLNAWTSFVW